MTPQEIAAFKSNLAQFSGSEYWSRHALNRNVLMTDGVRFVAEQAGAHWLTDKIATLQYLSKVKAEAFQAWTLKVKDSKATLSCDDGNGNIVYSEEITFTDFPLDEITIWVEPMSETEVCILLPSEH